MDSYDEDFEKNKLPKAEKGKTGHIHSDDLPVLLKYSTENNNNGSVVGQKRPITNNDCDNNTPVKDPCCHSPAKTVSDIEVDLEILNQFDQKHQIPQNLGDGCYFRETGISN